MPRLFFVLKDRTPFQAKVKYFGRSTDVLCEPLLWLPNGSVVVPIKRAWSLLDGREAYPRTIVYEVHCDFHLVFVEAAVAHVS